MNRKLTSFVLALLIAALALGRAGVVAAAPAQQTSGPQTWTVLVGSESEMQTLENGTKAGAWQTMKFYPDKITINEGDTILFKLNSTELHTVTFPAPGQKSVPFIMPEGNDVVVNPLAALPAGGPTYDGSAAAGSGLLDKTNPQGPTEYKLTFTKAGTYNYLCAVHSSQLPDGTVVGMTGSVTVQAAGSALSTTQAQIDADAQAAQAADAQAAAAAEPTAKQVEAPEAGTNGTMTYYGNIGFDTQTASYVRFAPTDFTIHVGDSIEWKMNSTVTPHTVTLVSGGKEPDLINAVPQQSGPPKLMLNPQVLAPAGGATYAGTGFFNSGFMNGTQDPAPGPRTYKLTFTKPGKYEYICMLHDPTGMSGYVTVLPAAVTPGMPTTGAPVNLPLFGVMVGILALLLTGFALRRRSAHAA